MKILLIYPYFLEPRLHKEEIAAVPMGVYYIGAMLKAHGHQVDILNWHAMGDRSEEIKHTLALGKPDIIGFSIVHANRWGGIDIARVAKVIDPRIHVVFGGIGASFLWRHLLTHFTEIDYVVIGEGERTFLELTRQLEKGASSDEIATLKGLAFRRDGQVVRTPAATPIEDLDALPPPARYFDFQHLSLTRGCPGRCTFCGSPQFWGRRVRAHSAKYFVDQLEALVSRGTSFFYVSDDTFTLNRHLVIEACQLILERGLKITWQAISKVSAVNPEMLYWMRKAGCVQISYGVESGAAEIRKFLCKDISDKQIQKAFDLTTGHGILARAYFIYGAPGETWDTIEQTLKLIRRIKPLSAIFYILDVFPGTRLYEEYQTLTGADDDIWLQRIEDILYFEADSRLDADTIREFGHHLRTTYHQWLADFARQIDLDNDASLQAEQADFLSRLAMTFSHGDYADLDTEPAPIEVAQLLYQQALTRHPDHRAFWGLTLVYQRLGDSSKAMDTAEKGLAHFPDSEPLTICRAVGLMNRREYAKALKSLAPFSGSSQAQPYIVQSYRALGRSDQTAPAGPYPGRQK